MDSFAEIVEILNCRKYIKRYYVMFEPTDDVLLAQLSTFGEVELHHFSKYSPLSKDVFHIKCEDAIEISGALKDVQVMVTLIREYEDYLPQIEQTLITWQQACRSKFNRHME